MSHFIVSFQLKRFSHNIFHLPFPRFRFEICTFARFWTVLFAFWRQSNRWSLRAVFTEIASVPINSFTSNFIEDFTLAAASACCQSIRRKFNEETFWRKASFRPDELWMKNKCGRIARNNHSPPKSMMWGEMSRTGEGQPLCESRYDFRITSIRKQTKRICFKKTIIIEMNYRRRVSRHIVTNNRIRREMI